MNSTGSSCSENELDDCLTQVYRMALAAMQSYTFWRYTSPDDSPYEATLEKFGQFFYATNEAHLTMMFVSSDCLYDDSPKLINFQKLLVLIKPKITAADFERLQQRIENLQKMAKGIGIIRNNSFAHISQWQSRMKMGEKYALSHGEYLNLCYNSLDVVTVIVRLFGRSASDAKDIGDKDVEQIQALFSEFELNQRQQDRG